MPQPKPSGADELFDFGVPAADNTPQFPSRRQTRGAASKRALKRMARAAGERRKLSRGPEDRRAVARAARDAAPSERRPRKLKRRELAAMRASAPKPQRKNPLSVLVTMTMVGGMFAVVGLPAYAQFDTAGTDETATLASQSLVVSADAAALSATRDGYRATTPEQLAQMSKDALRASNNAAYLASGARELGDDYPWPYELADFQGGGLSPLNYYYRECVDFVAWRLNRDAGYYAAPYKWVWSTLTPTGGNASQWLYAWNNHGWTVSKTPVVGSVAWFPNNHVSYVKEVLANGDVVIEEYNHNYSHAYSQRTIPASSVEQFLYPPT